MIDTAINFDTDLGDPETESIIDGFREFLATSDDQSIEALCDYVHSLDRDDADRALGELVLLHLRVSWAAGVGSSIEEYVERLHHFTAFESIAKVPIDVFEVEFLARHDSLSHADTPLPNEYARRFPDRKDVHAMLDRKLHDRGRYARIKLLGKGGLARVWLAYDFHLKRQVAIKIPHASALEDPKVAARLGQEARLTAKLNHPAIVSIHEFIDPASLKPFYVMPVVSGETLAQSLKKLEHAREVGTDQDIREAENNLLWSMSMVCDAVAYAHAHGVVHRDLKPQNIKVGEFGETIVLDWGLAKPVALSLEDRVSDDSEPTKRDREAIETSIEGTFGYMAPEQATQRKSDPRSDVFSLGSILYEALTGRRVMPPEIKTKTEAMRWTQAPSIVAPRAVRDNIPPQLEAICLKALRSKPEERYASPTEIKQDLTRYLTDEAVSALPESIFSPARIFRWIRRHRQLVITTAAMAFMAVGFLAWNYRAALTRERLGNRAQYRSQMVLASQYFRDGHSDRTTELLRGYLPGSGNERLRGWEWHQLARASTEGQSFRVGGAIQRLVTWGEGQNQRFAVARGNVIDIMNFDGESVRRLEGHRGLVTDLQVSPDGKTLASSSGDTTVILWDLSTGDRRHTLSGHILQVNSVRFHSSGDRLVTASNDTTIKVWDVKQGSLTETYQPDPPSELAHAGFLPDSDIVVIIGGTVPDANVPVVLWDTGTRKEVTRWSLTSRVTVAALSKKEPVVVILGGDHRLKTWKINAGKKELVRDVDLGFHSVRQAVLTANDDQLICGCLDRSVKAFDVKTGELLRTYRGHRARVSAVSVTANGNQILSASKDGIVRVWDASRVGSEPILKPHAANIRTVKFMPDGKSVLSCSYDQSICITEIASGKQRQFAKTDVRRNPATGNVSSIGNTYGHKGLVMDVDVSSNGELIASAGFEDKRALIWNAKTRAITKELKHPMYVSSIAVAPDGRMIGTGCWDHVARIWDSSNGSEKFTLRGHDGHVTSVAYSPDGRLLATGSRDHSIRIWDTNDGRLISVHKEHSAEVFAVAFSPDGNWLASSSEDTTVLMWQVKQGRVSDAPHHQMLGHKDTVQDIAFSPDSTRLATVSSGVLERIVRLWDVETGAEVAVLEGQDVVSFSPDGHLLAVGDAGPSIRVLDGSPLSDEEAKRRLSPPADGPETPQDTSSLMDDPSGGIRVLGYRTATAKRKTTEGLEVETRLLYVTLAYPIQHFVPSQAEYERRQTLAKQTGAPPLAPRVNLAYVDIDQFGLITSDQRRSPPVRWGAFPGFGLFPENGMQFTSLDPIGPSKLEAVVLVWEIGADPKHPFQVQFRQYQPVPVPEFRVGASSNLYKM